MVLWLTEVQRGCSFVCRFSEHFPLPLSHSISNIKTEEFETEIKILSSEIEVLTIKSWACCSAYKLGGLVALATKNPS